MWNVVCSLAIQSTSESTDPRPWITIRALGHDISCLVDTGAEVSLMDHTTYSSLPLRRKLDPVDYPLMAANNTAISVIGQTKIPIQIGKTTFHRTFVIVKGIGRKCLLGADTITEEKLFVDPISKTIRLSPHTRVFSQEAMVLAPFTERTVKVKIDSVDQDYLIEPKQELDVLETCVVSTIEKKAKLLLQNRTMYPIHIHRNEILGTVNSTSNVQPEMTGKETNSINLKPRPKISAHEVNLKNIPTLFQDQYLTLLNKYADIFSVDPNDIGKSDAVTQRITLIDNQKVSCTPPYRTPHHLQQVAKDYVHKLLQAGVVQKSTSPFNSPLLLVRKAGATPSQPLIEQYRVVHDFRRLNSNTIKDAYPMRNLYELLDQVSQASIWSVIDLSSGFWNQVLEPSSRKYTAFGLPGLGHFEYTRTAQGLCNSPAAFQRLLDYITCGLDNIYVYVDDIVVCSKSHDEHIKTLSLLFSRFRKYNIKCRVHKVQLATTEINYLGYNLSKAHGIRPGLAKTKAVENWKPPVTVKEIKQFLGLCSFFRRTIANFASIASPLTRLTRKDSPWSCGSLPSLALKSFELLRSNLCKRPCLQPVDFDQEFILTVDASGVGLGAVLSQLNKQGVEHPCAYASRTLSDPEKKWAPFHLEHLAMVWACKHFKPYLAGKHFRLRTDHKPLVALNKVQTNSLDRLSLELQQFLPYTIEYLPGTNMPADGLSRHVETLDHVININWEQLYDLQCQDPFLKSLAVAIKFNKRPINQEFCREINKIISKCSIERHVICYQQGAKKLALAPLSLRHTLLRLAHDNPLSGHFSTLKTLQRLQSAWFWPRMEQEIHLYCRSCITCNQVNLPSNKKPVPLEKLDTALYFNHRVHIDLLGPLPNNQGHKYAMIISDAYSKLVRVVPVKDKTKEEVGNCFLREWICLHGIPHLLVSDKGSEFANSVFKTICEKLHISHNFSATAHPQSNGQAERQVRNCISFLRKYLDATNDWLEKLPFFNFAYNSTIHSSIHKTPYFMAFGRDPIMPHSLIKPDIEKNYSDALMDQQLQHMLLTRNEVIQDSYDAFLSQKKQFDKRSSDKTINTGDKIYITRPHTGVQAQKFQPLFKGPYLVTGKSKHNLKIIPFFSTSRQVRPTYVHPNNVKLAPFLHQFFTFSTGPERTLPTSTDIEFLTPSNIEGDDEIPNNPPLDQAEPELDLSSLASSSEIPVPIQSPTFDDLPSEELHDPTASALSDATSPSQTSKQGKKKSPWQRLTRGLAKKKNIAVPDSVVQDYLPLRQKSKTKKK